VYGLTNDDLNLTKYCEMKGLVRNL